VREPIQPDPGAEQTRSLWQLDGNGAARPPLDRDAVTDVCIVGAGIAGLATAFQLVRRGKRVIVLDDGPVGGGETGRTTAHLASAIDDRYFRIEQIHGSDAARICYESHNAAIAWFEATAREERIRCGFERVPGFLFLPEGEDSELLVREMAAARKAGFSDVEMLERPPIATLGEERCLLFPRQAQMEPLAFLYGLAEAIERWGGRICCGTRVHAVEAEPHLTLRCTGEMSVRADSVVFATNSPVNDVVTLHTKQHAYRTYAIAAPVRRGAVPHALFWDTSQRAGESGAYHYVRAAHVPLSAGVADATHESLIVGGEDHKTGQENDANRRWQRLEEWARLRFPIEGDVFARWSGQVLEPVDHVAFIGRNPTGANGVYIATGDSGMGMTHGAIAGMLLADLITDRPNEWERLYDPARRTIRTAWTYAKENLNVAAQYTDWFSSGEVDSTAAIPREGGALIRRGLRLVACYRDAAGVVHERSAACPHLGGVVRWNSAEHTWDCPCHGSRFDAYGDVLNGPAVSPLAAVEDAAPARQES
jgi:glycine/D-amino acid oxidase-like deaminating enzyme/nitrite reductase/ring-hydroxylating ferredoxin subunit